MLLPDLDGAPPRFVGDAPVVSSTGAELSYVNVRGDLVLEALDGSNSRVLVPSADPTAMFSHRYVRAFTPDDRAVLMSDHSAFPPSSTS